MTKTAKQLCFALCSKPTNKPEALLGLYVVGRSQHLAGGVVTRPVNCCCAPYDITNGTEVQVLTQRSRFAGCPSAWGWETALSWKNRSHSSEWRGRSQRLSHSAPCVPAVFFFTLTTTTKTTELKCRRSRRSLLIW